MEVENKGSNISRTPIIMQIEVKLFTRPNSTSFTPATRPSLDQFHPRKSINLQACFWGNEKKNCSQGLQKTTQIDSEINKKTIPVTKCFVQYHQCENLFLKATSIQKSTHKSVQKVTWTKKNENKLKCQVSVSK